MTVRLYCSGPDCEGEGHRSGVGAGVGAGKAVPVGYRRKGEEQA